MKPTSQPNHGPRWAPAPEKAKPGKPKKVRPRKVCGIERKAAKSLKERRSVLEPLQSYEILCNLQTFCGKIFKKNETLLLKR